MGRAGRGLKVLGGTGEGMWLVYEYGELMGMGQEGRWVVQEDKNVQLVVGGA